MEVKVVFVCLLFLTILKQSRQDEIKSPVLVTEGETIHVTCDDPMALDNLNAHEGIKKAYKTAVFESCAPPTNKSYADILKKMNVDVASIKELRLIKVPGSKNHKTDEGVDIRSPKPEHFVGLQIEEFQLLNDGEPKQLAMDLKFLADLKELKTLKLQNFFVYGAFPKTAKLERIELSRGVLYGDVGECAGFKVVHLDSIDIFGGNKNFWYLFADCTQIEELKLENMDKGDCKRILKHLPKTLLNVTVRYSGLSEFPPSYSLFVGDRLISDYEEKHDYILKHLDLSHNQLSYVDGISTHKALETIDISNNSLTATVLYLPKLIDLKADNNSLVDYCASNGYSPWKPEDEYLKELPLKRISLSSSGLRQICFDSTKLRHLEVLNLTHNNISVLDYRQLYNVSSEFEVDLRHNPLERVEFTQHDYEALKRNDPRVSNWRNIVLRTDARLKCNCTHAWFARAVRERLLRVEPAPQCLDGTPLEMPRLSYAMHGCPGACEGTPGCSAGATLYNLMQHKDYIISPFTEQTSVWFAFGQLYDWVRTRNS